MYVAYWYEHYHSGESQQALGKATQSRIALLSLEKGKRQLYKNQLREAKKRMQKAITYSTEDEKIKQEVGKMWKLLTEENSKERQQIFLEEKQRLVGEFANVPVFDGKTAAQAFSLLSKPDNKYDLLARNLVNDIDNFAQSLDKMLDQAFNMLGSKRSVEEYRQLGIQAYAKKKNMDTNDPALAKAMVQDVLLSGSQSFVGLKTKGKNGEEETLSTSLAKLAALAAQLPEVKSSLAKGDNFSYATHGSEEKALSSEDVIKVLAGKVSGSASNINGIVGEIAAEKAEEVVIETIIKELNKINRAFRISGAEVKRVGTDVIAKQGKNNKKTVSKADVLVSISGTGVEVKYGISVKNYKPQKNTGNLSVKLVDGTPFKAVFHEVVREKGAKEYFYNIAAAKTIDNEHSKAVNKKDYKPKNTVSEATLRKQFSTAINNIGHLYFLRAIGGFAKKQEDNILFLNVNGKLISIVDIIEKIYNEQDGFGPQKVSTYVGLNKQRLSRSHFSQLNSWKKGKGKASDSAARERSNEVIEAINTQMANAKMNISLSMVMKAFD